MIPVEALSRPQNFVVDTLTKEMRNDRLRSSFSMESDVMNWLKQKSGLILIIAIAVVMAYMASSNWQRGREEAEARKEKERMADEVWRLSQPLLETKDEKGMTPLMWAVRAENMVKIRSLISDRADVNAVDRDGWSVLHHAADTCVQSSEAMETLISSGARVNAEDQEGSSPLLYASQIGAYKCVQSLLQHGANINMSNKRGETPLSRAANYGGGDESAEITVKFLLDAGANPNQHGMLAPTLLQDVSDRPRIASLLRKAMSKTKK